MCPRIRLLLKVALPLLFFYSSLPGQAQKLDRSATYKTLTAGPQYTTSTFHQKLWGKHYRNDWNTPVTIKLFYLDTAAGGLTPYQSGGGRQSKTLRLHDAQQREYVLRSIDKTFGRALPQIYQNTFVEKALNDQVSIAEPYAALTIPLMAEAAKIYHTWPQVVFIPQQKALDSFNKGFGNNLYLFEQRPDENWQTASNFGNSKNIISTEKVLEKISEDANYKVDQLLFIRSRLFDILIGDWGRHDDQWRWATIKMKDKTIYRPIPRDRDQAYTKFDGILLKVAKAAAGAGYLQSFGYKIKDVTTFNFPARNLDRRMANQTTLQQWTSIAKELQGLLTDEIITTSVQQMPPEVFANAGAGIIAKLKVRRDDLAKYAKDYYLFLAREVDIIGTKERDYFEVDTKSNGDVSVNLFQITSSGNKAKEPFYSRTFFAEETSEIRLYGLAGKDSYQVSGGKSNSRLRIIGGDADDDYKIAPSANVQVYDSKSQPVQKTSSVNLHLSNDSSIHAYTYDAFQYDKKGLSPLVFYNDDDRIFVGAGYNILNSQWRKQPFGQSHNFYARYSINQAAFSFGYDGIYNQVIGKWNLLMNANYDLVRWTNFFGLGNETVQETGDRNFYRIRSKQGSVSIGLQHAIGKQSNFIIAPFYQYVRLLKDEGRYLAKTFFNGNGLYNYEAKNFGGVRADLRLQRLNDVLLPTKGISFSTTIAHAKNLNGPRSFTAYGGLLSVYLPVFNHLVLWVQNGAATVAGEPEFYQLASIGGSRLRGHRGDRFWGQTIYYNTNELQYLFNVRSHLFNGKMGITGFADQGRVWQKGEISNTWHYGFGGGLLIVPFNKVYISLQYGVSKDDGTFHLDLRRSL